MNRILKLTVFALVVGSVGYLAGRYPVLEQFEKKNHTSMMPATVTTAAAQSPSGPVIYFRDPTGKPIYSAEPKKTDDGEDFVSVLASEDMNFEPQDPPANPAVVDNKNDNSKRIKFYRNPMGLPDTSPTPKKDSMGMAYIPVYAGDDDDGSTVKISPGRLQRTGVRSEEVAMRTFSTPIRAPGTIQIDEQRQSVMSLRFEAWIEKVEDVTTGMKVRKGEPLMRVYGAEMSAAAAQYVSVLNSPGESAKTILKGARRRLENLGVPESVIADITLAREVPLSVNWPAPRDGVVIERNVSDGMRAMPGDALFRVADVSTVWGIADVSERDLPMIAVGQRATMTPTGYPGKQFSGKIALIYPTINKDTRTARVRIEIPNPDGILLPGMYSAVEIASGSEKPTLAVHDNALIDNGERTVVILDKGEGRFEPREVKTGHRGEGFVEIENGLSVGDKVVVAANFLIDAESNLKAALQSLTPAGDPK